MHHNVTAHSNISSHSVYNLLYKTILKNSWLSFLLCYFWLSWTANQTDFSLCHRFCVLSWPESYQLGKLVHKKSGWHLLTVSLVCQGSNNQNTASQKVPGPQLGCHCCRAACTVGDEQRVIFAGMNKRFTPAHTHAHAHTCLAWASGDSIRGLMQLSQAGLITEGNDTDAVWRMWDAREKKNGMHHQNNEEEKKQTRRWGVCRIWHLSVCIRKYAAERSARKHKVTYSPDRWLIIDRESVGVKRCTNTSVLSVYALLILVPPFSFSPMAFFLPLVFSHESQFPLGFLCVWENQIAVKKDEDFMSGRARV